MGYAVRGQPGGNRVARVSVRPVVVVDTPERVEPVAPLSLAVSYAAGVMERPEPCANSNRGAKMAKQVNRSEMNRMGNGNRDAVLFLSNPVSTEGMRPEE